MTKTTNHILKCGADTYGVIVTPGISITVTKVSDWTGPVTPPKSLIFRKGDTAEHGSYNLSYTGPIMSIGAKTVAIQEYRGQPGNKRLRLLEFAHRNWDFDADVTAAKNHETMMSI